MSYFRVPLLVWEPQHYAARWTRENPAPEWWASIDAAWMIARDQVPTTRDLAEAWGWGRTRAWRLLDSVRSEQLLDLR